ncbi:MAG: hypothetical protein GC164_16505 [Phycisphaera sp.]|nr:hypothetical protein [Phycisphaera sp.]
MGFFTSIYVQVGSSVLLVAAVLFFMWKMRTDGQAYYPWGPPTALCSAWLGLVALLLSVLLWWLPRADLWLAALLLILDPVSIGSGVLVLWMYRREKQPDDTIVLQRVQGKVGIALGVLAVVLNYVFVMTHKTPFTPVGL